MIRDTIRGGIILSTHDAIYLNKAEAYEYMISKQPDLSNVINEIRPIRNLDVLDLGAGSGRLSSFIAKEAESLICTDLSPSMLDILDKKLADQGSPRIWTTAVADHRSLPIPDASIDVALSGWSICYLANSDNDNWIDDLELVMTELHRVLRRNGTIIILETMGTGTQTPDPPSFLTPYYSLLTEKYGFNHRWIRTDYVFSSVEEACLHTEFFFGEALAKKIAANQWAIVPECAGIWWKQL